MCLFDRFLRSSYRLKTADRCYFNFVCFDSKQCFTIGCYKIKAPSQTLDCTNYTSKTSSILNDPKYAWRNPNQTVEEVFQFLRQMWFSYLSKAPKHTDSPPGLPILSQFWFAQSCYVKVTLTVNYQEFERTEHFFPRSHVNQKCIHTTDTHAIIWVTPSWLMIVWSLQGGEGRGLYSEYASEWCATLPSERAFVGQKRRSLDKFVIIESSSF